MTNQLTQLELQACLHCDNSDPSHDILHLQRVVSTCLKIGSALNADMTVLMAAAWLHDVVNVPKNHPERQSASVLAAQKAKNILHELQYSANDIAKILQVIVEHSYSAGHKPTSLESQILQDADRLDAIGAIGVMRLASCGARMQARYYDENDPWAKNRELNDKNYSVDHVYKKLLKLEDAMNTEPAKEMAKARTDFLKLFLLQLQNEIEL